MQDSKVKIIIIILVALMILTILVGTILYFTTDMLKSSETLFKKYIAQNVQDIFEMVDISDETKTIDFLRKNDYAEEMAMSLKYLEQQNDEEETYEINEKGVIKNSENSSYRNIETTYGNNTIMSVDLLKQDNMLGLRLANLVQQFVSVQNATVSYFVSSLGKNGENFGEKLSSVDISGVVEFSEEEKQKLIEDYANTIFLDIDKSSFTSKSGALITLNNKQSVTTNAYTLTLTKNEIDKVYKRILNQAINDEIILSKFDNIDEKIKEAGFVEKEGQSLKEIYKSQLQKTLDGLEYQGEDNRKTTFTVYEQQGRTVRVAVKTETIELLIDVDDADVKTISFKYTTLQNQSEKTILCTVGKKINDQENIRTFTYDDSVQTLEVNTNISTQDKAISIVADANYKNDKITNLSLESKGKIDLSSTEEIPVNFSEKNNIILNNYDGDRVYSIIESLSKRAVTSLEKTQSIINTKLLNNILVKIDEKEQEKIQKEQEDSDSEKQKFNNKFILYEGEELEEQYIQKLLKTAGQNMTDYKVISGSQLRIFIKEGVKNEEKANQILTAISQSNEKYDVKLNYNADGYVETIDITVSQKK